MIQQIGFLVANTAMAFLCLGMVVALGRLSYIVLVGELWASHGWKLFKHPTLKPGARVTTNHWMRGEQVGTIEKQVYQNAWDVLLDGEPESLRYYAHELELVPPSVKAYEELFL